MFFARSVRSPPTVITSVKLYSCCAVQMHSLEKKTLPQFSAANLDAEDEILRTFYIDLPENVTSQATRRSFLRTVIGNKKNIHS
jgi:hypothetical protein